MESSIFAGKDIKTWVVSIRDSRRVEMQSVRKAGVILGVILMMIFCFRIISFSILKILLVDVSALRSLERASHSSMVMQIISR